jgi:hypothetical protein
MFGISARETADRGRAPSSRRSAPRARALRLARCGAPASRATCRARASAFWSSPSTERGAAFLADVPTAPGRRSARPVTIVARARAANGPDRPVAAAGVVPARAAGRRRLADPAGRRAAPLRTRWSPTRSRFYFSPRAADVSIAARAHHHFPDPGPLERAINAFGSRCCRSACSSWLRRGCWGATSRAKRCGRSSKRRRRSTVSAPATLRRGPVVATDRNEIGELVRAYNAAAQVSAAFDERRAAELEMRQFIADAGHELRTPLTVIMGFIDVLRGAPAERARDLRRKIYETMLTESRRMKTLIDKLIVLARLGEPARSRLETVDLGQVAGNVVSALQALQASRAIALKSSRRARARRRNELARRAFEPRRERAEVRAGFAGRRARRTSEGRRSRRRRRSRARLFRRRTRAGLRAVLSRTRERVDARASGSGSRSPSARSNAPAARSDARERSGPRLPLHDAHSARRTPGERDARRISDPYV